VTEGDRERRLRRLLQAIAGGRRSVSASSVAAESRILDRWHARERALLERTLGDERRTVRDLVYALDLQLARLETGAAAQRMGTLRPEWPMPQRPRLPAPAVRRSGRR
jgi:hypothetical protein